MVAAERGLHRQPSRAQRAHENTRSLARGYASGGQGGRRILGDLLFHTWPAHSKRRDVAAGARDAGVRECPLCRPCRRDLAIHVGTRALMVFAAQPGMRLLQGGKETTLPSPHKYRCQPGSPHEGAFRARPIRASLQRPEVSCTTVEGHELRQSCGSSAPVDRCSRLACGER